MLKVTLACKIFWKGFELSERVLQWEPNFKTSIDWSKVDNKLQSLRIESEQYVKSIIEK